MKLINIVFIIWNFTYVCAWDSEQLEVFDVVDEVKQNFYQLLNISTVCLLC